MSYDPAIERDFNRIQSSMMREYDSRTCVIFKSTSMEFGELSNMAAGFPLRGAGVTFDSPEALYQSSRFPHLPDVQQKIAASRGGMRAKMVSKPFRDQTREDWLNIRVAVMKWVLRVKLRQHHKQFGLVLIETGDKMIVEESSKDLFWGAKRDADGMLRGANVLGRLLVELRLQLDGGRGLEDISSNPPNIDDFLFFSRSWS